MPGGVPLRARVEYTILRCYSFPLANVRRKATAMIRVLIVSAQALFGEAVEAWLRQQRGLDVIAWEPESGRAVEDIQSLEPDVIIFDTSAAARDPINALMRFLSDKSERQIIGVNSQDNCISLYYKGHWVMQKVGDLLEIIQETEKAACSQCNAKEVGGERS
jgi:hypothetical protein